MRILVCGGRDYHDREKVYNTLWAIMESRETEACVRADMFTIIHGDAQGADKLADDFSFTYGTNKEVYPANWEIYGNAAGILRNKQMLAEGKPDLVVAFPGGEGTAHMVQIAKEANIPVKEIT